MLPPTCWRPCSFPSCLLSTYVASLAQLATLAALASLAPRRENVNAASRDRDANERNETQRNFRNNAGAILDDKQTSSTETSQTSRKKTQPNAERSNAASEVTPAPTWMTKKLPRKSLTRHPTCHKPPPRRPNCFQKGPPKGVQNRPQNAPQRGPKMAPKWALFFSKL